MALAPFTCAPAVAFLLPVAEAVLKNLALVRVSVADPNEETNPVHANYARPCNAEADGAGLQLFLGTYQVAVPWKLASGTPLNGIWEAFLDTRDISNGAQEMRVSARGVGCCRVEATRPITVSNTLQGAIFYRDLESSVGVGFVIPDAKIGIETRALEENTGRRYWMQWGVRSGTALDGPMKHEDWLKHQPVLQVRGESQSAQGNRVERINWSAMVKFRLPLSREVRLRRKYTPQFYLSCFATGCSTLPKIREIEAGRHLVFGREPGKVFFYDADGLELQADLATYNAADALDVALVGDKIYVVRPGEIFTIDRDPGQLSMPSGVRGETRAPRFIEALAGKPLAIYVDESAAPTPAPKTACFDLSFPSPLPRWTLPLAATLTSVAQGQLFIACGTRLFKSAGGTGAPALVREFGAPVTAIAPELVGLENGEVWELISNVWRRRFTREGAIGGAARWTGGTGGEANSDPAHGIVGGAGDGLSGQKPNGSWFDERALLVPPDLAPKAVAAVTAIELFSVDIPSPAPEPGAPPAEAVPAPERDERLLIGTGGDGLFFVYQRSALSEKQGAIAVSRDTVPRIFPFFCLKTPV